MKKNLLLIAGLALYTATAMQGQNIIPCWTNEAQQAAFQADPALKQKFELEQSMFDLQYQQNLQSQNDPQKKTATPVYTVPVVFHILHQNGSENISDQVCIDALAQVNKDYRKLGSDVGTINSNFASLYVDAEINFMLAHKDPNGNCTTGIVHHNDPNTNWAQNNSCSSLYTHTWDHTKYLNIYIVKNIIQQGGNGNGIIVGYTYNPGGAPCTSGDAIVYNYQFLTGLQARSLSHEIGHWLNLTHTFGNTNNPGTVCGSTSGGDGVSDTPDTKGYFSTCPGNNAGPFTGCAPVENMENFMDYSSCPKMFTQGQVTRMRTAIQSGNQLRNNIWTAANLGSSGTDVYSTGTCAPIADFYANKTQICAGQSVTFTDASYNGTVTTHAWAFQGGSPTTSSASGPTITFPSVGNYSVALTASNANGSNTATKALYVKVVDGTPTETAPYAQGFESGLPGDWNIVNGNGGSVTWAQANTGANNTSKSMYMNSAAGNPAGQIDILESPIYDFRYVNNITLSYYYAYARKTSTQADTFKIQYSLDCGGTWANVLGATDVIATMASNTGGTTSSAFTPTGPAQWHQKNVNTSLMTALYNKPNVKFRFYFRNDPAVASANNLYIDEINLNGTVGINELESSISLLIYPNPTNASSTVEFTMPDNETATVSVTDLLGRTMETSGKLPYESTIKYTVNKNNALSTGIYLVNIEIAGKRVTKKLVIE